MFFASKNPFDALPVEQEPTFNFLYNGKCLTFKGCWNSDSSIFYTEVTIDNMKKNAYFKKINFGK